MSDTHAAGVGPDAEDPAKNEKYVVFKRGEWEMMWDVAREEMYRVTGDTLGIDSARAVIERREIDDAVVIRRQDVFAPAALAVYANSIATCLDVARLNEPGEPTETTKRLQRIADYFHEQSELAYANSQRKLPD